MCIKLPLVPEPTEVELELTNHCNAKCAACPREELTAEKGFMSEDTFYNIINKYINLREDYEINKLIHECRYPIITFAGMGEPLMNKNIFDYIRYVSEHKFYSVLFTNVSLLNEEKALELVESGISHIYVSFWGIKKQEYEMSMGLNYENSLKNIDYLIPLAKKKGIPITIIWVKTEFIESSPDEINEFWEKKGVIVDTENDPWNRGGYLDIHESQIPPQFLGVDFNKEIWCSQLYFTDTICWNGDQILCSCDYYKKENILGNLNVDELKDLAARKKILLSNGQSIPICTQCKKPDRNYSFGSEPWDEILGIEEKSKYIY